jgi:uncharacterized protein YbbK (DUF523 family)
VGKDATEAKSDAARNALNFLKAMAKRSKAGGSDSNGLAKVSNGGGVDKQKAPAGRGVVAGAAAQNGTK